jgi:hypothetical protein
MPEDFDVSRELQEFIVLSLGLGLDNLQKSGSLMPMVVSVKDSDFSLGVLTTAGTSVMDAGANYLASLITEPDRYALIFNGEIGEGNTVMSAVIAHVGERGGSHGYTVFQSYDSETFSALGQPQYIGHADQLLGRQT